jgi:hypothetical protein
MSVLICGGCTARYSVGAERCPQCGANEPREEHETPLLASLTVACLPGRGCRYTGVQRRVMLPQIVPGVIDMPQLYCAGCGAALVRITDEPTPQQDQEDSVPKTTVHTGPSNEVVDPLAGDGEQPEQAQPADAEGSEDVSPGTSSSTSSEKPPTSPQTTEVDPPQPARKTGSRSSKGRTGSSTVPSTAGDQTASAADGDEG